MSNRIQSLTVTVLAASFFVLALTAPTLNADTIYVDDDAPLGGDGLSWDTPFKYLQDALFAAGADQSIVEIRVGQGSYKPDQDEGGNVTPGDREETFQVISGLALCGGYAGMEEPDPDLRDIKLYETVLSGDIGTPDYPGDNSHRVVTGSGTDQTAVLDGFTITSGRGGSPSRFGAGMYNSRGSPTVLNCLFHDNATMGYGGGMFNSIGSPVVVNCVFSGNSVAEGAGGGMFNTAGSPMVIDCVFAHNDSWAAMHQGTGGGMATWGGSPTVVNCLFVGNWANGPGAAVESYLEDGQGPAVLVNCTISGNWGEWGGAVAASPGTVLTNCIVWDNVTNSQVSGGATIGYSCIGGGWPGQGNIDSDPLFIDPDGPDDNPNTWEDNNYRLSAGSPCINAGSNYVPALPDEDIEGSLRIQECRVDMGAYESPYPPATFDDCNNNDVEDDCEVYDGTSDDYDQNHVPDECEDCNENGIPDGCDLDCARGNCADHPLGCGGSEDCQPNGVPDECDIAGGTSDDCNGNGLPDECEWVDCNDNGVLDECDIDPNDPDGNGQVSEDCNENGIPDECDLSFWFLAKSGPLSPIGDGSPQTFTMLQPPLALENLTLHFEAVGDLGAADEWIKVNIDSLLIGYLFVGSGSGHNCPDTPDYSELSVAREDFNLLIRDGQADINMVPSVAVDPYECDPPSYIMVRVEYLANTDCNANGVPDECDIADGTSDDVNGNGIPDECECVGDIDGDGDTNQGDLGELLSAWGSQPGDPNWNENADIDGNGEVGHSDLGILLADWGCEM